MSLAGAGDVGGKNLVDIYRAALAAVEPGALVANFIAGDTPDAQSIRREVETASRVAMLAAGKAAVAMISAGARAIGDRLSAGLAIVPLGTSAPATPRVKFVEGSHPVPDEKSEAAANAALQFVSAAHPDDLLIFALSGGTSAMMSAPCAGISLAEKAAVGAALMRTRAPITELNCVRKHLSRIKGGRLAIAFRGASIRTLILSDVAGNDVSTIGSGPTAPDSTSYADAIAILKRRKVWGRAPESIRDHLERGLAGEIPETPKPSNPVFLRVVNTMIGDNRTALDAAAKRASAMGYRVLPEIDLSGEVASVAAMLAEKIAQAAREAAPFCIVAGGEPTLEVRGGGRGGRMTHLALAFAIELDSHPIGRKIAALAAGSDGIDGPTDAAGGFAADDTCARARAMGIEPNAVLARCDSYSALARLDNLLITGPSGTNVSDIFIALVD
jgi:hydroxypyruvate reductase